MRKTACILEKDGGMAQATKVEILYKYRVAYIVLLKGGYVWYIFPPNEHILYI